MNYGYFDKENNEYVVTRPDTPTPWINYLGQGKYSNSQTFRANGVGATCSEVELKRGEEKELLYFLGKIDKREDALQIQKQEFNNLCIT